MHVSGYSDNEDNSSESETEIRGQASSMERCMVSCPVVLNAMSGTILPLM